METLCKLFEKFISKKNILKIIAKKFAVTKKGFIFANSKINGPFVYRLGRMVFIHVRGVRLPYGLQFFNKEKRNKWQIISQR